MAGHPADQLHGLARSSRLVSPIPALYHNNQNGTFTDVTKQAGLAIEVYGQGCAVGDYDNDGNVDIYITAVGSNHLFRNLGHGKFVDVTAKAGVADPGFSSSALWFDYDNDGKLDLFVAHYIEWSIETDQYCTLDNKNKSYCTPQRYKGQSATLFHNKGNGTFENVTRRAGLYDPTSKSLGVAMLDYDNDGWVDLFVSNDTEPNKLYHNNHDGTFTDVAIAAGVAYGDAGTVRAGMGTDAADYDNSGWQSLVIGNFTNEGMALYHSDGSGLFTDEAPATGIARLSTKSLTFGTFFFDYDLDGLPDLLAVNGHVSDDVAWSSPPSSMLSRRICSATWARRSSRRLRPGSDPHCPGRSLAAERHTPTSTMTATSICSSPPTTGRLDCSVTITVIRTTCCE